MAKIQEKFKKVLDKLIQDYGKEIKVNLTPVVAIYIKAGKNIGLEEFGILPSNQTTVFLPIEQSVNEEDIIEVESKVYRVKEITVYFGIVKKLTLEKTEVG